MHEYSIVQALLDRVNAEARQRGATAVFSVSVRIGDLSGVDADLLASAYDLVRAGTLCASATLDVARMPAVWECEDCESALDGGRTLRCVCGGRGRLRQGDEIVLDRIDMEVPDVRRVRL